MTIERIEELLGLLPSEAPYLARIPRSLSVQGFPREIDIRGHVLNDPSFGWNFIQSFLDLGRPLPAQVYEWQLLRPYCYLRYAKWDQDARAAIELQHPAHWQRRVLLRGMLIRAEYEYGAVANKLHLSEAAVRMHEALFWNVRDRDRIYLCSLVYPETRLVEFVPGYVLNEDPMNLALRAALDHGIVSVEELLGLKNPVESVKGVEHAKAFAARSLSAANFVAKIGGIHQNLPALANARHVLTTLAGGQQKEKNAPGLDDDDVRGLGGMGRQCSLRETFLAIRKPELERQLALQKAELSKNGKPSSEPTSRESCRMP